MILTIIKLRHPTIADYFLEMNFAFDAQPQVGDIMRAFAYDPFLSKHEHRAAFRVVLHNCLKTFGVPKLFQMDMIEPEGSSVSMPMVQAVWIVNLIGKDLSVASYEMGAIRLFHKTVNEVTPPIDPDSDAGEVLDEDEPLDTTLPSGTTTKAKKPAKADIGRRPIKRK
jgi:hypothetical protein